MKIIMTKGEIIAAKGLMDRLGIDSSILCNLEMETKYASIKIEGDKVVADVSPEYYKEVVDFTTAVVDGVDNLPWALISKRIGFRFFAQLAKAWRYACKAWKEFIKADLDSAVDKFLDTHEVVVLLKELGKKAEAIEQKWE